MAKFINHYLATGSGRRSKISAEIQHVVEEQMRKDDEMTASQLDVILTGLGYHLSL